MPEPDGWVLFRAASDLGPWLRWSAAAQSLLMGAFFAGMLLLTAGQLVVDQLPFGAAAVARIYLTAAMVLCLGPFLLLGWRKHRRRCHALALDPLGFTLHDHRGADVRLRLEDLAGIEVVAEPTFTDVKLRWSGSAHRAPPSQGFVPTLRLRARNGRVWEYATSRVPEVEGFLAWLDVLGARDRMRTPPSSMAASIDARASLRLARLLLSSALGAATATTALVITYRLVPRVGEMALGMSLFTVMIACSLYVGSFLGQVQAARGWLLARGLAAGPPLEEGAAPLDTRAAEALAAGLAHASPSPIGASVEGPPTASAAPDRFIKGKPDGAAPETLGRVG